MENLNNQNNNFYQGESTMNNNQEMLEQNNLTNIQEQTKKISFSNFDDDDDINLNVKIIGVGGAGCNVINQINNNPYICEKAKLYAFNTDKQHLASMPGVANRFILNKEELRGHGSGGNPSVGQNAVIHDQQIIRSEIQNTDLLILITGMGKGTGSGSTPEIAKIAKELGILTIAIVYMPSIACEGLEVYNNAITNLEVLSKSCTSLTTISNEYIIEKSDEKIKFFEAYKIANEKICRNIQQLLHIIHDNSLMNVDFADLTNFFKKNRAFLSEYVVFEENELNKEILQQDIMQIIDDSYCDVSLENAPNGILNLGINEQIHTQIIDDIRSIFVDITGNDKIDLITKINKLNKNEKIYLNFILAGELRTPFNKNLQQSMNENRNYDDVDFENQSSKSQSINLFGEVTENVNQSTQEINNESEIG